MKNKNIEIKIDHERCKGCGLCIKACEEGCLALSDAKEANEKGYSYARTNKRYQEKCKLCRNCAIICPDAAIERYILDRNS